RQPSRSKRRHNALLAPRIPSRRTDHRLERLDRAPPPPRSVAAVDQLQNRPPGGSGVTGSVRTDSRLRATDRLLAYLLRRVRKGYVPAQGLPSGLVFHVLLSRFTWLARGWVRFRRPVFVAPWV